MGVRLVRCEISPTHAGFTGCFYILQKGFDVFNALDLMENKTFLEKLKFGIGDGNLQYYLYNWKCPSMGPEKVNQLYIQVWFIKSDCQSSSIKEGADTYYKH